MAMIQWAQSAFVLVINALERPETGEEPSVADLGFGPARRGQWRSRSGSILLRMWEAEPTGRQQPPAWTETDGTVSLLTGHRLPGEQTNRSGLGHHPPSTAPDFVRGIGASLQLDADGSGWIAPDPLGLRCLYVAETDGVLTVASRAALVARRRAGHAQPARNATSACWLAYSGYWVGSSSGWAGVEVLQPGAWLQLRVGRPRWHRREPLSPDSPVADSPSPGLDRAADGVMADVSSTLLSVLEQEAQPPVIRLTGGKDSRLVLAVAVHAGLAREFSYETVGYPGLADADVASELANRLGLHHELRFIGLRPAEPYADRFAHFVAATGGMVNAWSLDTSTNPGQVVVTGICGELLRSYGRAPDDRSPEADLTTTFAADRFNLLGLVQPDVASQLRSSLLDAVATEPAPGSDPRLRHHAHFAGHRMRFARLGPREELSGDRRIQPLYSPATIDAAMTLTHPDRQSELLFAEIMRRSSSILVDHRFAGPGWDNRARAHLGSQDGPARTGAAPQSPVTPPPAPAPAAPLMAAIGSNPHGERIDLLTKTVADHSNPAWDVLNRPAFLDALARFAELQSPERLELFGAATVATWLAQ